MAPVVHGLEKEYADQIHFVYLNVNDPRTFVFQDKLRVLYQPEYYLLDAEGKVIKKFIGFVPKETFEEEFRKVLE